MDRLVRLAGHEARVRASIGVATSGPDDSAQPRGSAYDLLRQADVAMFAAKLRRAHSLGLYADGLADPATDVSLSSSDVIGVEASFPLATSAAAQPGGPYPRLLPKPEQVPRIQDLYVSGDTIKC